MYSLSLFRCMYKSRMKNGNFFFKFPCFEFSCSFCSAEFPYLHDKRSRNIKKILFSTLLLYIPWSLYSTVLKCSFFQNDLARLEFIQSITIWFSKVNCLNVVILESSYNISVIICVKGFQVPNFTLQK